MKKLIFTLKTVKITALFVMVLISGAVLAQEKITICHCPPGNPNKCHSITIAIEAWAAHLANHAGDYVGSCTDNPGLKLVEVVAYPNPSIGQTAIEYDLCEESIVTIDVYNEMGYKVQSIVSETKPTGTYTESFSAETSGLYLLNVTAVTPYEAVQSSQIIVEMK
ncbi:MAG: T9SS type A sorting domain-containing protein [Bacteroidota bacterium]